MNIGILLEQLNDLSTTNPMMDAISNPQHKAFGPLTLDDDEVDFKTKMLTKEN